MNIAIDISPLKTGHFLQHRVRGTGFYLENLKKNLAKYYSNNEYTFFTQGEKISSNVDLVHYPYFEPFFLTLPFRKQFPTVVTVHDLTPLVFPKHFPPGIRGSIKWRIQKFAIKNADAIIADSHCSKKDIIKYVGISDTKIHVVHLAASEIFTIVRDSLILRSMREKYNFPKNFALYVGDVTWNKNLPRLIEAIKKIDLPLVMVGKSLVEKSFDRTNPWNQDLAKVQGLTAGNKQFYLLGFVPNEDLVALYNLATVFVMPSLYEGFGLPVLEAMSCGCPVVTSKEGSLPEVAGEAAYYVDAYDIHAIAQGISEVYLSSSLRKKLARKGLAQAKKFSWKKTVQGTIQVYESVLKKK